jgi:hypothetical protein
MQVERNLTHKNHLAINFLYAQALKRDVLSVALRTTTLVFTFHRESATPS